MRAKKKTGYILLSFCLKSQYRTTIKKEILNQMSVIITYISFTTSSKADENPDNSDPGFQCNRPRMVHCFICQRESVHVTITPVVCNIRAICGGLVELLYDKS